MSNIIIKPILTEKATNDSELKNRFAFVVARSANKIEIKNAIEKMYNVHVSGIRTMNYGGGKPKKKYTSKGVSEQANPVWKKAVVSVVEGETIDLYDNI